MIGAAAPVGLAIVTSSSKKAPVAPSESECANSLTVIVEIQEYRKPKLLRTVTVTTFTPFLRGTVPSRAHDSAKNGVVFNGPAS